MDSVSKRLHHKFVKAPPLNLGWAESTSDKSRKDEFVLKKTDFALVLQERQKKAKWLKKIRVENESKSDYVRYSLEHLLRRRYEFTSKKEDDESVIWERDVLQKGMQAAADEGKSVFMLTLEGPFHEKTWKTVTEPDLFGRAVAFMLQKVFYSDEMRIRNFSKNVSAANGVSLNVDSGTLGKESINICLEISWKVFADEEEMELPPLPTLVFMKEEVPLDQDEQDKQEKVEKAQKEMWLAPQSELVRPIMNSKDPLKPVCFSQTKSNCGWNQDTWTEPSSLHEISFEPMTTEIPRNSNSNSDSNSGSNFSRVFASPAGTRTFQPNPDTANHRKLFGLYQTSHEHHQPSRNNNFDEINKEEEEDVEQF